MIDLSDRCIRIPLHAHIWIPAMWAASFILLVCDSIDRDFSLLSVWGGFIALSAATWAGVASNRHSRRVVLEVMSWEHRMQGMPAIEEEEWNRPLALIDR